jgi:hypothetical protein
MVPARRMNPLPSWIPTPLSPHPGTAPVDMTRAPRAPWSPLLLTPCPADRRKRATDTGPAFPAARVS